MASLLLTVLLVCMAARWAEGAAKELGETCFSSDTCVHPTLDTICDQELRCSIKQGQACSGDGYSTLCVAGAECTGNVCTCKGSVYSNDGVTGKCTAAEDKYGGACPSAGAGPCTAADNLECLSSVCLCDQSGPFSPNLADGTCTAIAAIKVGRTCDPNSSPEANTACGVPGTTNLECSIDACVCKTGYTGSLGGDCTVVAQQLVGRTCTAGAATDADKCGTAATTNLDCTANTNTECACAADYYGVMGGACYAAKGTLGGGCGATSDCTGSDSNSECGTGSPKTCQCAGGYYDNSGTCDSIPNGKVGAACTSSNEATKCPPASNLECDTTTTDLCVCKSGYSGPTNGDCSKNSSAVELVGSLVTVTLAAILHVFMRD